MKQYKKGIIMLLIITLFVTLTGCGIFKKIPMNTNMSLTLNVETGDSIKVTLNTTGGYKLAFDNKQSMFQISKENDGNLETVMQGVLMTEETYDIYYNTMYAATNGNVVKSGVNNTLANGKGKSGLNYSLLIYENTEEVTCEYLGWIIGSNTGVVFETIGIEQKDSEEIFDRLTFDVEKTMQTNELYVFEPELDVKLPSTPSDTPSTTITPSVEPSDEPSNINDEPSNTEEPSTTNEPSKDDEKDDEKDGKEEKDKNDWAKLDIKVDGVTYSYPYSYKDLQKAGWSFELEDYGYGDGYVLAPNEYTFSTISLYNEKYGDEYDDATIKVGFQNFSDKEKDIMECDVWAIGITAVYGSKPAEKIPNVELAGGIKLGSTMEQIIEAYGEPESTYEGTYYTELDYQNKYSQYMKLYVYKEYGLMEIDLRNYN